MKRKRRKEGKRKKGKRIKIKEREREENKITKRAKEKEKKEEKELLTDGQPFLGTYVFPQRRCGGIFSILKKPPAGRPVPWSIHLETSSRMQLSSAQKKREK